MKRLGFGIAMVSLLLAAGCEQDGGKLITSRPRMLVSADGANGALSVAELRERIVRSPFKERVHLLRTTRANLALKWLIYGGDENGAAALKALQSLPGKVAASYEGVYLVDAALAYDWLFAWEGFTEADKKAVEVKMLDLAGQMRSMLHDEGAHIFHTRMYAWCAGLGAVGLALHDRRPEARALWVDAKDYYETRLLPARRLQGGAMHNGLTYGPTWMMFPMLQFMLSARSAAGVDWFHTPNPADSQWLRDMADYLVYATRPNLEYISVGDNAGLSAAKHVRFMLDIFAAEYRNRHAAELAEQISERLKTSGYHAEWIYLFLTQHDPAVAPAPLEELPRFRVFSREALGHAFCRSGWGQSDTLWLLRCGDYFGNHGHFDQGSFTVFRRTPLAMKGGSYIGFDVEHRHRYYKQAISTNTVIFNDPSNPDDEGRQRNINYQDASTMSQYAARRDEVETGSIPAVDDPAWASAEGPGLVHSVVADVSPAWDPAKVNRYVRSVAFIDGRHMVVVDETETARPDIRARWLLHTQDKPAEENGVWRSSAGGSVLLVRPLLPMQRKVMLIGGPGKECEVNGDNPSYVVAEKGNSRRSPKEPKPELGLWRMEIESAEPASRRVFVTVLTAGDEGIAAPPASAAWTPDGLAVTVGDTTVTFHKASGAGG